jgi:hypothetical protein
MIPNPNAKKKNFPHLLSPFFSKNSSKRKWQHAKNVNVPPANAYKTIITKAETGYF